MVNRVLSLICGIQTIHRMDLNFFSAWHNKGNCLEILGKYDEAIKCYDRALEIDPDNACTWYHKGLAWHPSNDQLRIRKTEALKFFDRAIEINPKYPPVWRNKGICLEKLGWYDETLECYNKAVELAPLYDDTHVSRNTLRRKILNYPEYPDERVIMRIYGGDME